MAPIACDRLGSSNPSNYLFSGTKKLTVSAVIT
jgi:hypothetical protein